VSRAQLNLNSELHVLVGSSADRAATEREADSLERRAGISLRLAAHSSIVGAATTAQRLSAAVASASLQGAQSTACEGSPVRLSDTHTAHSCQPASQPASQPDGRRGISLLFPRPEGAQPRPSACAVCSLLASEAGRNWRPPGDCVWAGGEESACCSCSHWLAARQVRPASQKCTSEEEVQF